MERISRSPVKTLICRCSEFLHNHRMSLFSDTWDMALTAEEELGKEIELALAGIDTEMDETPSSGAFETGLIFLVTVFFLLCAPN